MTDSKSTKRSLAASIGCIALCVVMLVGTTFAWFTDTATTGVSKVQAGTLDVQLVDKSGQEIEGDLQFVKAAEGTDETVLWEPGCTYNIPEVYVKNNGNLALKYKIQITGITGDAKLNNAIEWTIKEGDSVADLNAEHSLASNKTSEALTISGHMKDDAGNEYQNLSIEGISITVVATQDTVEHDSTTKDYDLNATYPAGSKIVSTTASGTVEKANEATKVSSTDDVVTVTIPKDTLKADDKVALTVDRTAMTTDSVTFDIDFKVNGVTPTEALKNPISATVNIGTGLNSVTVTHNGKDMTRSSSGEDQTYSYNPSMGILTIVTSTFSPFKISYQTDPEATVNGVGYASFVDALNAAKEGDTVKLVKDITIDGSAYSVSNRLNVETNNLTIDLNGKTFTAPNCALTITGSNITVKNGTMIATANPGKSGNGSYVMQVKGAGVSATVDGVTTTGGINVSGANGTDADNPDAKVTVGNCNITATGYYTICAQRNASVTITNSTLTRGNGACFWIEKQGYADSASDPKASVDSKISYQNSTVTINGSEPLYNTVGIAPTTF